MISRIIEWCEQNRFLVFTGVVLLTISRGLEPASHPTGRASRHQRCAGGHSHRMAGRATRM